MKITKEILKSKVVQIIESVKTSTLLSQKKDAPLLYAFPCDNYMDSNFLKGLVKKVLLLFADQYCKEQILNTKSTGQLVCQANYPQFYDIFQGCYNSTHLFNQGFII